MASELTLPFIKREIAAQTYEITLHADDERLADGITMEQLENALGTCTILENYPDDPRGPSCLVLGYISGTAGPVHVVCGRNRAEHLTIITVYIPGMPKWKDHKTRNR